METGEKGEILNPNEELTPAEHLFFVGSSTYFNGEIVNINTLDKNLRNPDFQDFFVQPLALGRNPSEQMVNKVNKAREKGVKIFAPLFLNTNTETKKPEDLLTYNYYVELPKYDPNSKKQQWRVKVVDEKGKKLTEERVRQLEDCEGVSSILKFSYDSDKNELVVDLELPDTV